MFHMTRHYQGLDKAPKVPAGSGGTGSRNFFFVCVRYHCRPSEGVLSDCYTAFGHVCTDLLVRSAVHTTSTLYLMASNLEDLRADYCDSVPKFASHVFAPTQSAAGRVMQLKIVLRSGPP
jgi:hypothetical protein